MIFDNAELYDSSALSLARTCLFRFYCRIRRGRVSNMASALPLKFGQALHLAVEEYLITKNLKQAIEKAQDYYSQFDNGTDEKRTVSRIHTLMDAYQDTINVNQYDVIEAEKGIVHPIKDDIMFCGRFDMLVKDKISGTILLWDVKTTYNVFSYVTRPHNQFSGYLWLAREVLSNVSDLMIDLIGIYKTMPERGKRGEWLAGKGPNDCMVRYVTTRTDSELDEWKRNTCFDIDTIHRCIETGIWPKNTESCRAYNHPCEYLLVCQSAPEMADQILEDDELYRYEQWIPYPQLLSTSTKEENQ